MDLASLPVLSLKSDPASLAAELGGSFRQFGFAMVTDHGIAPELIAQAWQQTRTFFALPEPEKRGYFVEGQGGARGYTDFPTLAEEAQPAK